MERRYREQDPSVVSGKIRHAATKLADHFDVVQDEQWDRTGSRSDGARFTVDSFARYLIHDPVHHVHDVEKGYRELRLVGEPAAD